MTERTELQGRQQHNRRGNGQYELGPQCEACGKPAGHSYFSDERCNEDGIGLVLCGRKRCDGEGYVKRTRLANRTARLTSMQTGTFKAGE